MGWHEVGKEGRMDGWWLILFRRGEKKNNNDNDELKLQSVCCLIYNWDQKYQQSWVKTGSTKEGKGNPCLNCSLLPASMFQMEIDGVFINRLLKEISFLLRFWPQNRNESPLPSSTAMVFMVRCRQWRKEQHVTSPYSPDDDLEAFLLRGGLILTNRSNGPSTSSRRQRRRRHKRVGMGEKEERNAHWRHAIPWWIDFFFFFYVRTQHTEAQMNQITCQWSNDDDERVPFFYIVGVLVFSFKRDVNWKRAFLSLSLLAFRLPSLCRL